MTNHDVEVPVGTRPCVDVRPPECVEQFNRIEHKIDQLTQHLTGNGRPDRGVIVRLDRLEQRSARLVWVSRAVVTTIISTGVALLLTLVYHLAEGPK